MTLYLKHEKLVEYRQAIAALQVARGKAMEREIAIHRLRHTIEIDQKLSGLRWDIDTETGEVIVQPDGIRHDYWPQLNELEKHQFDEKEDAQ